MPNANPLVYVADAELDDLRRRPKPSHATSQSSSAPFDLELARAAARHMLTRRAPSGIQLSAAKPALAASAIKASAEVAFWV